MIAEVSNPSHGVGLELGISKIYYIFCIRHSFFNKGFQISNSLPKIKIIRI